ncbi:MAG: class II D-tagatose-bisphosphate aldolase, non-catalytic subunit, partial [Bacillota bacterium]
QLRHHNGIVFEGHSTDYQLPEALRAMVRDGVGILKVGPELTFALREGLFALQYINSCLGGNIDFIETLDSIMLSKPHIWQHYYTGSPADIALKRKFSYSDRWRYCAADKQVADAAQMLCSNLNEKAVPLTLLHQFLPEQYMKIRRDHLKNNTAEIVKDKVKAVLQKYYSAVAESSVI